MQLDHTLCDGMPSYAVPAASVRLVGGPSNKEGILQIWRAGEWGSVCNGGGLDTARVAYVVCHQLRYKYGIAVSSPSYSTTGRIWLDTVDCDWSATKLEQCHLSPLNGGSSPRCGHKKDLAIKCSNVQPPCGSTLLLTPTCVWFLISSPRDQHKGQIKQHLQRSSWAGGAARSTAGL